MYPFYQLYLTKCLAHGVPVYTVTQSPGTFIVTFPQAYHCGFNCGFNCAEAVNFATSDWLQHGHTAYERYRMFGRTAALSFVRLIFTLLEAQSASSSPSPELVKIACSILEEELTLRPQVFSTGVRSMSHLVQMPKNSFSVVDKTVMDYDDKRVCHVCKCVCVFSAVVCECSFTRVACIRHESLMCKCARCELQRSNLQFLNNLY